MQRVIILVAIIGNIVLTNFYNVLIIDVLIHEPRNFSKNHLPLEAINAFSAPYGGSAI